MVNVKLLKKVRKLIAEEPKRLWMPGWGYFVDRPSAHEAPCGTNACLAGWINLASTPKAQWRKKFFERGGGFKECIDGEQIACRAARLIGLSVDECPFYQYGWKAPEVLAWIDRQIDAASK